MSLLRPVLATVSVLLLAACAAGSGTSGESRQTTAAKAVSERSASGVPKSCLTEICDNDDRKRWSNHVRAKAAGIEPAAAIDLYEPFGIPIGVNGPLPRGIKQRKIMLLRAGMSYDGIYPPFMPPVPSEYFPWVSVSMGIDGKIGSVEGRTKPLSRAECIRRLENLISYWEFAYSEESVMRHPGRQPERHYMVPMLDTRQSNAYAWCGLANDWDEYELWVSFISRAGANPRDYWRSIAEWPNLR